MIFLSQEGWIKVHRKIQECFLWSDKPYDKARAWIDLLLLANHSQKSILFNGENFTISRGQYLTSVRKLADRWSWSYDKVTRYLKMLEKENMLRKESDKNRTLITIVNYEVYQDLPITDKCTEKTQTSERPEHQQVNDPNTNRTPTSDKQECKELKNEKNEKNERKKKKEDTNVSKKKEPAVYYPNDEKLNQAFADFVDMRKQIKKPMTDRAITLAMNKLKELSTVPFSGSMDNETAIKILEQSTMNCWQGLFPLKESNSNKQNQESDWVQKWRDA